MATMQVQTEAAKTNRSLSQPDAPKKMRSDRPLLFWRKLVSLAFADAKKTANGMPTDIAILARWWIADHRPKESDTDDWERSFECACHWLDLDAKKERERLLKEIDAVWSAASQSYARKLIYQQRAAVLACAGVPTAIGRQYVLGLVSRRWHDEVSGGDSNEMF